MRVVTIDGPAGAGKSTISRQLAARLGWRLLDTGAMFRAVTLAGLRAGLDLSEESVLADLVERLAPQFAGSRVMLDGEDVTNAIRTPEVTRLTRYAAASPSVRTRLVVWQREQARALGDVVTEGRDQGSVVFPDAPCKFYLDASPEERARRRHAEDVARGEDTPLETVLREILQRDEQDRSRAIAPLRIPENAVVVDSTRLSPESLVDMMTVYVLTAYPELQGPTR